MNLWRNNVDRYEEQERAFNDYISLCEETCRHDQGESEERLVLEYLETRYCIQSCRYDWGETCT